MANDFLQREVDPVKLQAASPWFWADYNKIKLVGGEFELKGHQFQVEMLDDDSRLQCAKKATQMSFTETMVLKMLHGLRYQYYPRGVLYLFPTRDEVTDFSDSRFSPLIKENEYAIGQYVRDTNRANMKRIGRAYLYFRSGRLNQIIEDEKKSSSKLKSIPVDAVVFDEVDEMDPEAITLAKGRLAASAIKQEFYIGNPTIPDYGIDKLYQKSDQRIWVLKCPACNKEQCLELEFPNCLRRRNDGIVDRVCVKCGTVVNPETGQWVATRPDRSKDFVGRWISHVSSVYVDPTEILDAWEDPTTDRGNFYNVTLGMAYIAAENRLTTSDVYACCSTDPMPLRHVGPTAMGIDVQGEKKGFHVVIAAKLNQYVVKIVKVCRPKNLNDLYDLVRDYGVACIVADIEPETRLMRDFMENVRAEGFLCDYQEGMKKTIDYDTKEGLVKGNRTEICDNTNNYFRKEGRLILPRQNEEIREYATQMSMTAKVLEEDDKTGKKVYRYKKLGNDDYYHATNYMLLALARVSVCREEETVVRAKDAWDSDWNKSGYHKGSYMGM